MAKQLSDAKIAFVGAGSMAEALIKGICHTGVARPDQIYVANRHRHERREWIANTYGVHACQHLQQAVALADIIFLCTKPKDLEAALTSTARHAASDPLYISVAAGCSIDWIRRVLVSVRTSARTQHEPRIVRTMPNTSCAVLESATAYSVGAACTEEDARVVHMLLQSVGAAEPIEESLLNAVTGLSGSGPAYVYYLVEALTQAGMDVGLDEKTAASLVAQTLFGAAAMLRQSGDSPTVLRERVTSPGGTTMAGLAALEQHGFSDAVRQAVRNATVRAEELGSALDGTFLAASQC